MPSIQDLSLIARVTHGAQHSFQQGKLAFFRNIFYFVTLFVALLLPSVVFGASLPMTLDLDWVEGNPVPFQSGRPMIGFDPQDRPTLDLSGTWKKLRFQVNHDFSLTNRDAAWLTQVEMETGGATQPDFDDSTWADHEIPGVENQMPAAPEDPVGVEVYSRGIYYRRHISVPSGWNGEVVRLICLGADYVVDLWVNGQWIGYHEGGYAPFAFDISEALDYGADNVIVFRVDAMPWSIRFDILPTWFATDWQHYVGIVQDLYLEAAPPVNVVRADVIPQNTQGDLDIHVVLENQGVTEESISVEIQTFTLDSNHPDYLTDPSPQYLIDQPASFSGPTLRAFDLEAGEIAVKTFEVRVESPRLWTPDEPNLYALKVLVKSGSDLIDTYWTQFGVRTIEVGEGAKMLLNDRPAFFTGMARHEDWPDTGRTASMEQIAEDLQIIRDTNVWFLRTAHYPNHPYTYLLTDRMGFAVWEEIPAWWIMQFTIPVIMNRGLAKQMWREMIFDQRNRPSVLLWSLCNEPMWYLAFNLREYVQDLHSDLDDNFPDGRLVTQSLAADGAALTQNAQQDVDVAGWTMYFGVFYGDDINSESMDFIQGQFDRNPDQPIIVSEFGYWGGDQNEYDRQVEVADESLDGFFPFAALDTNGEPTDGPLAAVTWWCQFNWYRVQDPHIQKMGIMHMDRVTAKPVHQTLVDRYQPYFEMGGLGPKPNDDDDDTGDDDSDDDTPADDDDTGNDDLGEDSNDDDNNGCGC